MWGVKANKAALANLGTVASGSAPVETILTASAGSLTLTPQPATLTYTPWTPADLPGLEAWFANESLEAIGDAQPCANFPDSSGNGRDAVQATGTNQPTVRLNADGIYEVKGDGVDDYMVSTFGATIAQPTTVWGVGSISANEKYLLDGIATGNRHGIHRRSSTSIKFAALAPTVLLSGLDGDALLRRFIAIFNGADSSIQIDAGTPTAGDAGAHSVTGLTLLGAFTTGFFTAGVLRDAGLCSGILAGDDLTNLEAYLAALVP